MSSPGDENYPGEDLRLRRCEKLWEVEEFYDECRRLTRLAREAEELGFSADCQMYLAMLIALEAPADFDFEFDGPPPTVN